MINLFLFTGFVFVLISWFLAALADLGLPYPVAFILGVISLLIIIGVPLVVFILLVHLGITGLKKRLKRG